jgi:hypothetical protein
MTLDGSVSRVTACSSAAMADDLRRSNGGKDTASGKNAGRQ